MSRLLYRLLNFSQASHSDPVAIQGSSLRKTLVLLVLGVAPFSIFFLSLFLMAGQP
jgi:hypothetical protein